MRLPLILSLFLLVQGTGWGCESYEECMQKGRQWTETGRNGEIMKAIAFKLDEISQKLDNLPPPDPFRQIAQRSVKKK